MKDRLRQAMRLYAVTDRSWLGDSTLCEQAEQSLKGGVTFLQLRENTSPGMISWKKPDN